MSNIVTFIEAISKPQLTGMHNPWSQSCETEVDNNGYIARRERLKLHLECPDPRIVMIGEAAGYQGCRYSGLAFTSERLLMEGKIPCIPDLNGIRITERGKPWSEPSATIVWGALHDHGLAEYAVLFNAVPWHPEGSRGKHSNRPPSKAEKEVGLEYLEMFLLLFKGVPIAAVGNTASDTLNSLDIKHAKLRHPANGGAPKFREGIKKWSKMK
jgi:hypothetical protein